MEKSNEMIEKQGIMKQNCIMDKLTELVKYPAIGQFVHPKFFMTRQEDSRTICNVLLQPIDTTVNGKSVEDITISDNLIETIKTYMSSQSYFFLGIDISNKTEIVSNNTIRSELSVCIQFLEKDETEKFRCDQCEDDDVTLGRCRDESCETVGYHELLCHSCFEDHVEELHSQPDLFNPVVVRN